MSFVRSEPAANTAVASASAVSVLGANTVIVSSESDMAMPVLGLKICDPRSEVPELAIA